MRKIFIFAIFIFCIGCIHMNKFNTRELYIVTAERDTGDELILPLGWEHFFVYGGNINFLARIYIESNGKYSFKCPLKSNSRCNSLEATLTSLKNEGIKNIIRIADISKEKDITGFTHFDGGDFEYYMKTEIVKFEDPRFWDVFIEKYVLETGDNVGYRMITPEIGKKYLKANQNEEMKKNELWDAIIWLPGDIVKEKDSEGNYIYKDGYGNTEYNPWNKKAYIKRANDAAN